MRFVPPSHAPRDNHRGLVAHLITEAPPEPGSDRDLALRALETVAGLPDALRKTVSDALWQRIPTHVQEFGRNDAFAAGVPVAVSAEFGELVLITDVVVSVPAGTTATLQLGDQTFPNLGSGVSSFRCRRLLSPSDVRQLVLDSGAGGPATVALYGEQTAPTGSMAP